MGSAIVDGSSFRGSYAIRNTDRTVGGRIAGRIARVYGDTGLESGSIELDFAGSAGQSFGAWLIEGMSLTLIGEANDYVAKGMHGGQIIVRAPDDAGFDAHRATLVGNTVLYGATGGHLFVGGRAGERFAVRNSGGCAVVEGVGKHCCEYMTGGTVVVLGETGRNFAAGMSGGIAYVLDERGDFPSRLNPALASYAAVADDEEIRSLHALIQRHLEATGSSRARNVLAHWQAFLPHFRRIAPKDAPFEKRLVSTTRRRNNERSGAPAGIMPAAAL
jgi:glutamate synthase domain-containing protein 3